MPNCFCVVHSVGMYSVCGLILAATDTAKNQTGVANAPFKNGVPLHPLGSQLLDTCSQTPIWAHGSLCRGEGSKSSVGEGACRGRAQGVFWVSLPCGNHWGPMVPRSSGFRQCLSGVLEAPGTSKHLFPEADSENTQGTVQLGWKTLNKAIKKSWEISLGVTSPKGKRGL